MSRKRSDATAHGREWIARAEEDYRAAAKLEAADVPNVICFHCHQCIEKYLKALLIAHGEAAPRTHDLVLLNERLEAHDAPVGGLYASLETLNPYAVLTRYPGSTASIEDARAALQAAQSLRADLKRLWELDVSSEDQAG